MTSTPTDLRSDAPSSGAPVVPEKPALEGLEEKWARHWAEQGTYAFVRPETREQVYSIDTPPPTVSGSLHVGHVFSYTHTDLIARYQRMRGKHVFYPIGWDDNGLPTERRVQNYYGVRCDPSVPYDPDFAPPFDQHDTELSIAVHAVAGQHAVARLEDVQRQEQAREQHGPQWEHRQFHQPVFGPRTLTSGVSGYWNRMLPSASPSPMSASVMSFGGGRFTMYVKLTCDPRAVCK